MVSEAPPTRLDTPTVLSPHKPCNAGLLSLKYELQHRHISLGSKTTLAWGQTALRQECAATPPLSADPWCSVSIPGEVMDMHANRYALMMTGVLREIDARICVFSHPVARTFQCYNMPVSRLTDQR